MSGRSAQARDFNALLAAHAHEIRAAWKKSVLLDKTCQSHLFRVLRLQIDPSKQSDWYRECEGIPAECVIGALTHYVEASLPWLAGSAQTAGELTGNPDHALVLMRWAARQQIEILSARSREIQLATRQFSARLADGYEKERRRLAHDLHDGIGHDLIVLKLYTEKIALDLRKGVTAQLPRKIKDSISLIKHALATVRSLTFDLGPAIWDEQGFLPAVRAYTRQFARRTGIKVRLNARRLRGQLPPSYEAAFYQVLQGAMSNVVAHSGAKNVTIVLSTNNGQVCLQITDDGRGFDVERKMRTRSHSFGLRAIKRRIELLGGYAQFKSTPAGEYGGTTIRVCVPANDVDCNEGTRDSPGL